MSQENVEMMRRWLEAFDRRDRAAWLALRDAESEVIPSGAWPEGEVISGREAAWDFYVQVADAFAPEALGGVEIVEGGPDRLLIHHRSDLRGRASGVAVEIDYWVVVRFRAGRILREEWFADRAEAVQAAGLSE
jgi:ketosteroid isomerase-like protein